MARVLVCYANLPRGDLRRHSRRGCSHPQEGRGPNSLQCPHPGQGIHNPSRSEDNSHNDNNDGDNDINGSGSNINNNNKKVSD
eukprot:scaffold166720_cov47-Prasinocladus_malaysianus.AAC.2